MIQRDATLNDASNISRFVVELTTRHIAPSLTTDGLAKLLSSMDMEPTCRRIADGWLHLLHMIDNELRGVIVVKPRAHLYHLFVDTAFQGMGVGRMLFDVADDRTIRDTGPPIATVNSSLNAIGVYSRFGFAASGPVVDADGVRYQPMIRAIG